MALEPEVEALIGMLPAEQQTGMRDRLTKGYLRQEDYSRNMNELRERQKAADEKAAANVEWWNKTGQDAWKAAEATNAELAARNAELEAQIASAAAGTRTEGAIDPAQLDTRVKAELDRRGYVSKTEMQKLVDDTAAKIRDEAQKSFDERLGANMVWSQEMAYQRMRFERDFPGETLDRQEFAKFMTERGLTGDPAKAMEEYTAPRRQKLETEKEIEKARAEARDQALKEMSGRTMPGNPGAGSGESAAVKFIRQEDTGGFVLPKGERLGNGSAARAAAAELVAAGKG